MEQAEHAGHEEGGNRRKLTYHHRTNYNMSVMPVILSTQEIEQESYHEF